MHAIATVPVIRHGIVRLDPGYNEAAARRIAHAFSGFCEQYSCPPPQMGIIILSVGTEEDPEVNATR